MNDLANRTRRVVLIHELQELVVRLAIVQGALDAVEELRLVVPRARGRSLLHLRVRTGGRGGGRDD